MAGKFVVDTHAILWFLTGDTRLGANARASLSDPASESILPAIVLAEACQIIDAGRSSIPTSLAFIHALDADPRVQVVPLDRAIVEATLPLAAVGEMHDRQVVATALQMIARGETVAVLTRDVNITNSGLVPVEW